MDVILDPTDLLGRLMDYYGERAPEEMKPGLKAILMEPVQAEKFVRAGPFLYAHFDLLDDGAKELCGQFFAYADAMHWTSYNEQNQSASIVLAVRRDLGEKGKFPKPEDDPQPNAALREDGVNWHPAAPEPLAAEPLAPPPAPEPDAPAQG